jgi:hypothetical protein
MAKKKVDMPDRWTSNGMGIHSGEISPERKKAIAEINAMLAAEDKKKAMAKKTAKTATKAKTAKKSK